LNSCINCAIVTDDGIAIELHELYSVSRDVIGLRSDRHAMSSSTRRVPAEDVGTESSDADGSSWNVDRVQDVVRQVARRWIG